jgi:hypothetical protein
MQFAFPFGNQDHQLHEPCENIDLFWLFGPLASMHLDRQQMPLVNPRYISATLNSSGHSIEATACNNND